MLRILEHWLNDSPLPGLAESDLDIFQSVHDVARKNDVDKLQRIIMSCSSESSGAASTFL